ncbi:MAG: hypothetical protein EOO20_14565 [Chryseobacterium sp.]|nr:MAG: hypothetical protein EOO20_14565 [Chryseobacterium sp.]
MDAAKAIQILQALTSGYSPTTEELLDKGSILNDRQVLRALQIAIDALGKQNHDLPSNVQIDKEDVQRVMDLFRDQQKTPSAISLTGFFLGTRQFKNIPLVSHNLYGKFRDIYSSGQLIDFFTHYLNENRIISGNSIGSGSFKDIDFFQKERFNRLSPSAINQLKEKVNELGVVKTENLSDYIKLARTTNARAYEHWSDKELELLSKAIQYTNDLDLLSECFQRGKGSIESVGQKIVFKLENAKHNS